MDDPAEPPGSVRGTEHSSHDTAMIDDDCIEWLSSAQLPTDYRHILTELFRVSDALRRQQQWHKERADLLPEIRHLLEGVSWRVGAAVVAPSSVGELADAGRINGRATGSSATVYVESFPRALSPRSAEEAAVDELCFRLRPLDAWVAGDGEDSCSAESASAARPLPVGTPKFNSVLPTDEAVASAPTKETLQEYFTHFMGLSVDDVRDAVGAYDVEVVGAARAVWPPLRGHEGQLRGDEGNAWRLCAADRIVSAGTIESTASRVYRGEVGATLVALLCPLLEVLSSVTCGVHEFVSALRGGAWDGSIDSRSAELQLLTSRAACLHFFSLIKEVLRQLPPQSDHVLPLGEDECAAAVRPYGISPAARERMLALLRELINAELGPTLRRLLTPAPYDDLCLMQQGHPSPCDPPRHPEEVSDTLNHLRHLFAL